MIAFWKQTIWTLLAAGGGLLWLANGVLAQQLAFSLPDVSGPMFSVEAGKANATVVCFLGTQCPMAKGYASKLNELQAEFSKRKVGIVGVMSNRQDSPEDIARYATELDIIFPLVKDEGNRVADSYGASRTPEVFLLDRDLKLRYHGRIDDRLTPGVSRASPTREDLKIAIEEILAAKPVSIRQTRALGCIIGRIDVSDQEQIAHHGRSPKNQVTFTNQVSRVLQRHCIECHRAGEIGPFAMDKYEEVVGWAETMLETVESGRMPPWHADPKFGSFVNERLMPEEDKQILRDWIEGGLQHGNQDDLPEAPRFVDGWNLPREPDLVVEMRSRPFTVPREGVVEYQYFVADPGLEKDAWVTSAQVIPGSRSVVHHAIVFVRPPDGDAFPGIGWLAAYVPGQRVHELPPGRARKIPAGSKFVFQMHYTPNGVEQSDTTKIGLLFGNSSEVTHEVITIMAIHQELEIPPGEANYTVSAQTDWLPRGADLLAITPHMHVRGKSFKLYGSNQPRELLLSVPQYDFNWQHTYQLQSPLSMQGLGKLQFEATFDNSASNPFNPDPTETVTWGDQTWEEMAVAFMEVARPLPGRNIQQTADAQQPVPAAGRREAEDPGAIAQRGLSPPAATGDSESDRQSKIEAYVARAMRELDANGDGQITRSESAVVVRHLHFGIWDLDGDSLATRAEIREVAENLFRNPK